MKHLKTYEGLIADIEAQVSEIRNKARQSMDDCLQVLIDDYGLTYDKFYNNTYSYKSVDISVEPSDITLEDFISTERKLKELGVSISYEFFFDRRETHKVARSIEQLERILKWINVRLTDINIIIFDTDMPSEEEYY